MSVAAWFWLLTVAFGITRAVLHSTNPHVMNSFAAAAHLYVGMLFGFFLIKCRHRAILGCSGWQYLLMALALTATEAAVVFLQK